MDFRKETLSINTTMNGSYRMTVTEMNYNSKAMEPETHQVSTSSQQDSEGEILADTIIWTLEKKHYL